MKILEIYSAALAEYKAKNYSKALELQAEAKKINPSWTKNLLLEAYIYRDQNLNLQEIKVLENFLPYIDISNSEEKKLAAVGLSLLGAAYRNIGDSEKATKFFIHSSNLEDNFQKSCAEISNAIFSANDGENFSATDFQKFYSIYQNKISVRETFPKKNYNHKKIRVGYISADFAEHPVMEFAWSLIFYADKNFFEIYCYSSNSGQDWVTKKIISAVKNFRDISKLNDLEAAELIRADEIDILFDFSGHTASNRLLTCAYRPAPVQISGIGYMNSTGLKCFDYFLSDKICAENSEVMKDFFTEKIIKMPETHWNFTPIKNFPAPIDAPCIKNNFVTFGCFNNFSKVTNSILAAWKKILDAVPKSKLILKHKIFDNSEGKNFVAERLKNFDFNLSQIEMRGYSENYLEEYLEIDIALDTFPYVGGSTTCEAIYCGVPVVSLYGERHGTRFGLSILKNLGLENLAAPNFEEYIFIAESLARNKELLSYLHKNLRQIMQNSLLMDSKNYVREIEKFYFKVVSDSEAS